LQKLKNKIIKTKEKDLIEASINKKYPMSWDRLSRFMLKKLMETHL